MWSGVDNIFDIFLFTIVGFDVVSKAFVHVGNLSRSGG